MIPPAAMPVVEVLRRDVPRPEEVPTHRPGCTLRWRRGDDIYCPMGLHPKSRGAAPSESPSFACGECDDDAVMAFAGWWDSLTAEDVPAAMDEIWPRDD